RPRNLRDRVPGRDLRFLRRGTRREPDAWHRAVAGSDGRGTVMGGHAGFVVCGECGSNVASERLTACLRCGGSGLLPTDELREKATDTLLHVLYLGSDRSQLGSTQVRMHERAADAVLRLVAEHLGERE